MATRMTTGLTTVEADLRLAEHGSNSLPDVAGATLLSRILDQVRDPMILLLLVAGSVTAGLGDVTDTVIIAAVVLFNTGVGVLQQLRADHAMAAIRDLATPTTHVVRDGACRLIDTDDVVPGDVAEVTAGDVVPADGALLTGVDLTVDESHLTGESLPVLVRAGDRLSGGSLVTRGRGAMLVDLTGLDSGIGRIGALITGAVRRPTPLQRRLSELSRRLVLVVAGLTAVVVVIGLLNGRPLSQMVVVGLSLAVAAVPESLPAVVTIALAMGARRMARRNAVVRSLPAVEALGSVTVVATDKTGTITEGTMSAERVWTPSGTYTAAGQGYAPSGRLEGEGRSADPHLARALRGIALCNDAALVQRESGWTVEGDPLEGALLALAGRADVSSDDARLRWPRIGEAPFDQATMMMRTRHRDPAAQELTVVKGAPEAVLDLLVPGPARDRATQASGDLATAGFRVLAVADDETGTLDLVALIAIGDPPRDSAARVVAELVAAGICVKLVTGDHRGTALAIADRVGIEAGDVHARVRPEEKVALVERWQAEGEVVAMLGDGVNDAPALRSALVGVAAGRRGSEVAKEVADVVLLDDDLATVVAAVEEGRRIFANIRSFLTFALAGGLAEVAVMVLGPVFGVPLPLVPAQILWINLVTHGLTGIAFGGEPVDAHLMAQGPVPPAEAVFAPGTLRLIGVAAATMTVLSLLVAVVPDLTAAQERTAVFLALGLGQLGVAVALRSRPALRPGRVHVLDGAVLVGALLLIGAGTVPALQAVLRTATLPGGVAASVAAVAVVPWLVVTLLSGRRR